LQDSMDLIDMGNIISSLLQPIVEEAQVVNTTFCLYMQKH